MAKYIIEGKNVLEGTVKIQGSTKSTLPILAATILCQDECVLHNCPNVLDIDEGIEILRYFGCSVEKEVNTIVVDSFSCSSYEYKIPKTKNLTEELLPFAIAILLKTGKAKVNFFGCDAALNCEYDVLINALKKMGVTSALKNGCYTFNCENGFKGSKVSLEVTSFTATVCLMLAAVTADGTTTIVNAAQDPEIADLAEFLNKSGANILGAGENKVVINGAKKLHGVQHTVIPDRLAASFFMACAAATGSNIILKNAVTAHLDSMISFLENTGCIVTVKPGNIKVEAGRNLAPQKNVSIMQYPGLQNDVFSLLVAMLSKAKGVSIIKSLENYCGASGVRSIIYCGAEIDFLNGITVIFGSDKFSYASLPINNIYEGIELVVVMLMCEGTSKIENIEHIERKFENLHVMLSKLGASIKRIN